jgi:excisionase family DNA binding protein
MNRPKIITIDLESLTEIMRDLISEEFNKAFLNKVEQNVEEHKTELLTRKECAKFLKISTTTLWKITKEGELSSQNIGSKVLYLRDNVENYIKGIR